MIYVINIHSAIVDFFIFVSFWVCIYLYIILLLHVHMFSLHRKKYVYRSNRIKAPKRRAAMSRLLMII